MQEIWKPIPFLDGRYEVSNHGRIRRAVPGRRTSVGRVRMLRKNSSGYLHCVVCVAPDWKPKDLRAHIAVAYAFLGAPTDERHYVNHKDGNKTNNHVENLEWCTARENILHARRTGLMDDRKPVDQYTKDGKVLIAHFSSLADAARATGIPIAAISCCCHGEKTYVNRTRTAGGYVWKIDGDGVHRLSRNGARERSYTTIKDAARDVGVSSSLIYRCARDREYKVTTRVFTAHGYHWKFSRQEV